MTHLQKLAEISERNFPLTCSQTPFPEPFCTIGPPTANPLYANAAEGCLDDWKDHPNGALTRSILFDQVPATSFADSAGRP